MAKLTEDEILAYTLLGEAVGEGPEGMAAVMHVIANRAGTKQYGSSLAGVALKKNSKGQYQFSTWGESTPPDKKFAKSSTEFKQALAVVQAVKSGSLPDPTGGAQNYYANKGANAINKPYWFDAETKGAVTQIGNHVFAGKSAVDPQAANYTQQLAVALQGAPVPATMSASLAAQRRSTTATPASFGSRDAAAMGATPRLPGGVDYTNPADTKLNNISEAERRQLAPQIAMDQSSAEARRVATIGGVGSIASGINMTRQLSGATPGLVTRKVTTVPINPLTGQPTTAAGADAAKKVLQDRIVAATLGGTAANGGSAVGTPQGKIVPSWVPQTSGARYGSVTETVRKDGTVSVSSKPGSVAMPADARPSIVPKMQVPSVVKLGLPEGTLSPPKVIQYNPGGNRPSELGYGGDTANQLPVSSWTTKLITTTVKIKNPAYRAPAEATTPTGSGITAAERNAFADLTGTGLGVADKPAVPVVPEYIDKVVTVEKRVPVLQKPASSGGGSSGGSGGMSTYVPPPPSTVKIATGKTATVGQTYQQGSNGSGQKYTYQVQSNGSIKNLTTGRITAPATR